MSDSLMRVIHLLGPPLLCPPSLWLLEYITVELRAELSEAYAARCPHLWLECGPQP